MTNPIVDMPRNPNLRLWARAFAQREQRLPKVVVLSDSLAEAMGNTGPLPAWPYRLFEQQRVYIPAHSTWVNGDNTWDAGILSGNRQSPALPCSPVSSLMSAYRKRRWSTCLVPVPRHATGTLGSLPAIPPCNRLCRIWSPVASLIWCASVSEVTTTGPAEPQLSTRPA